MIGTITDLPIILLLLFSHIKGAIRQTEHFNNLLKQMHMLWTYKYITRGKQ